MSVRVNVSFSKKLGLPNYSSLGASCSVEAEIDSSLMSGKLDRFQHHVQRLYGACSQAVVEELQRHRDGEHDIEITRNCTAVSNGREHIAPRQATKSQVRAIQAIASQEDVDLAALLHERFGLDDAARLSISRASDLIDELKHLQASRQ